MLQSSKDMCFLLESHCGVYDRFRTQSTLAHLLDCYLAITQVGIFCFIHCPHATFSHDIKNTIALVEQVTGEQASRRGITGCSSYALQRVTASTAKRCLRQIFCSAGVAEKGRRNHEAHPFFKIAISNASYIVLFLSLVFRRYFIIFDLN